MVLLRALLRQTSAGAFVTMHEIQCVSGRPFPQGVRDARCRVAVCPRRIRSRISKKIGADWISFSQVIYVTHLTSPRRAHHSRTAGTALPFSGALASSAQHLVPEHAHRPARTSSTVSRRRSTLPVSLGRTCDLLRRIPERHLDRGSRDRYHAALTLTHAVARLNRCREPRARLELL